MSDFVLFNKYDAVFDDVKHLLYEGNKYVVFDVEGCDGNTSFLDLLKYSKERFPGNVFESETELDEYLKSASEEATAELEFKDFKLNSDGLIPCIAQDYRTGEVLIQF